MCTPNCSTAGCDQPASILDMDALRCKSHRFSETTEAIARMEASLARAQAALDRMEASGPERTGVAVGRAINAAARRPRGGAA